MYLRVHRADGATAEIYSNVQLGSDSAQRRYAIFLSLPNGAERERYFVTVPEALAFLQTND